MSAVGSAQSLVAAADPTASYTYTDDVDLAEHAFAAFIVTASGDAPTSFEAILQESADGTNWSTVVRVNEISAGAIPHRGSVMTLYDDDGTVLSGQTVIPYARHACRYVRLGKKRTGGGAGTLLAVSVALGN